TASYSDSALTSTECSTPSTSRQVTRQVLVFPTSSIIANKRRTKATESAESRTEAAGRRDPLVCAGSLAGQLIGPIGLFPRPRQKSPPLYLRPPSGHVGACGS